MKYVSKKEVEYVSEEEEDGEGDPKGFFNLDRPAKKLYLATSVLKFPAIVASSVQDYKHSCNKQDADINHKKLKFRAIDSVAELSNEVSLLYFNYYLIINSDVWPVLIFDAFRAMKYLAKFSKSCKQKSKRQSGGKDVSGEEPKDVVPIDKLMEEFDLTKEDVENLTEDEINKLLSDMGLTNGSIDNNAASSAEEPTIGKKIKLATCLFLGAIESIAPIGTNCYSQNPLTRFHGRHVATVAKLLRYIISCESRLGKIGASLILCYCLLLSRSKKYFTRRF